MKQKKFVNNTSRDFRERAIHKCLVRERNMCLFAVHKSVNFQNKTKQNNKM